MATVTPSVVSNSARQIVTWAGMATGDTIVSVETDNRPVEHITCHLYGTWGGSTVTLTGGFDNSNFDLVPDAQGTGISKTADAMSPVGVMCRYWLPTIGSGSGDSVTCVMAFYYAY